MTTTAKSQKAAADAIINFLSQFNATSLFQQKAPAAPVVPAASLPVQAGKDAVLLNMIHSQGFSGGDVQEIMNLVPAKKGRLPVKYRDVVLALRAVMKGNSQTAVQPVVKTNAVSVPVPMQVSAVPPVFQFAAQPVVQQQAEVWGAVTNISMLGDKSFLGVSRSSLGRTSIRVFVVKDNGYIPTRTGITLTPENVAALKAVL